MEHNIFPDKLIKYSDVARGVAEIAVDRVKGIAVGLAHLAVNHFLDEGKSDYFSPDPLLSDRYQTGQVVQDRALEGWDDMGCYFDRTSEEQLQLDM